ncbi:condensation domain-containing protein, partial [Pseudoalteromonas sp. S3178]
LQPERSLSHSPLFQVMLSLQNNDQGSLSLPGLELSMVEGGGQTAKFDLTLNMAEEAGGLGLYWEFNTAVFKDETIVRMAEHFEVLLSALLQSPERDVFSHELVTSREREQLLESRQDIECFTP